jgi:hemolysin III
MATAIFAPPIGNTLRDPAALANHPIYGARPALRGRSHQVAALASVPFGVHLVGAIANADSRLASFAYAVTWTLMLTTSAAYHRVAQGVLARFWMRRLDHSMILVHIAGGTTPIALLGVGGNAGWALCFASWSVALTGAAMKMTTLTAEHDPCPWVFPLMGWLPMLAIPALFEKLGWGSVALLIAATLTYTGGAVCFARKSPDPMPTVFGYHEVWHVFTLLAGGLQLLLTIRLVAA